MNKALSILLTMCSFVGLHAQFRMKLGNADVMKLDTSIALKYNEQPASTRLNTSSNPINDKFAKLNLYILRQNSKVSLNLTLTHGQVPDKIIIERKTSNQLSEFRSIKEFSKEDLFELAKNSKVLFEDKYPEPAKLDCYYRVVSQYNNEVIKYSSPVLLIGEPSNKIAGATFGDHEKDLSLFIAEVATKYKLDITLLVDREDGKIFITLIGGANLDESYKLSIERMSNEKLPMYRPIKEFASEELSTLINIGLISMEDKYPASSQFASYYRLVARKDNRIIASTDPVELPRL